MLKLVDINRSSDNIRRSTEVSICISSRYCPVGSTKGWRLRKLGIYPRSHWVGSRQQKLLLFPHQRGWWLFFLAHTTFCWARGTGSIGQRPSHCYCQRSVRTRIPIIFPAIQPVQLHQKRTKKTQDPWCHHYPRRWGPPWRFVRDVVILRIQE